MQIEGTREFFSKISSLNKPSVQNNNSLSGNTLGNVSSPTQNLQKPATDTLFLSDIGKKLSLNANKAPALSEKQEERITDPYLKILDKTMLQAKDVLEKMHELAVLAQNNSLTDLDRVNLQIASENLRSELEVMPMSLYSQAQGGPPIAKLRSNPFSLTNNASDNEKSGVVARKNLSNSFDDDVNWGNNTSVLDRMLTRVANGEKWDVREAWSRGFTKVTYDDEGEEIWEVYDAAWHVVSDDDKQIFETKANVEYGADTFHVTYENVPTGKIVPTVREVLESSTPIILMDTKSAANGAILLEERINSVQKWRDRIAEANISEQPDSMRMLYEAANDFSNIGLVSSSSYSISLNEPTRPYLFLGSNGVTNQRGPVVVNIDITRYENTDSSDGPDEFTNKPIDDSYNGFMLDPDVLSKVLAGEGRKISEGFTTGVTMPEQSKTVYIKGL